MKKLTEIKPRYVLPIFFAGAILVNLAISRPLTFGLTGFSPVSLHANATADYSADPLDLIFPVLDPDIMVDALQDQSIRSDEPADSNAQATPTPVRGATPTLEVNPSPTNVRVPPLPTNTLTDPILTVVETLVPLPTNTLTNPLFDIVDGVVETEDEILEPICIPILLISCP